MSNKALMTALGTALAVAGGLYLYNEVIAKSNGNGDDATGQFRGRRR